MLAVLGKVLYMNPGDPRQYNPNTPPAGAGGQAQNPWAVAQPGQNPWAMVQYVYPMMVTPGIVEGRASEYREGRIALTETSVLIQGSAIDPNTVALGQLLGCLFVGPIGLIIGSLIAENAARRPKESIISWRDVVSIVVVPEKQRICVLYSSPDRVAISQLSDKVSLAFRLGDAAGYENFCQVANHYAPGRLREGKIKGVTPLWAVIVLCTIILVVIVGLIAMSNS